MSEEKINFKPGEELDLEGIDILKKLLQGITAILPKDICDLLVTTVSTDFLMYNAERFTNLKTADTPEKKIIIAASTEYISDAYELFVDSMKHADLSTECKMNMISTVMLFKKMKEHLNFIELTSVHISNLTIEDKDSIDKLVKSIHDETQLVNDKLMNIISKSIHACF